MSERVFKRRTRSSLSQDGVFSTSRSLEEFMAFTDYDLFPWLNEVKQILQIHIAYKIAMDSCCLGSGMIIYFILLLRVLEFIRHFLSLKRVFTYCIGKKFRGTSNA